MTKQHLKAIIKHDLAEAIEGASHFGNNAEKVPIDFLIDKIADLQYQINELRENASSVKYIVAYDPASAK